MARARPVSVLIVSAFAPELAPLVAWLNEPARRALRARVACVPAGIGAIEAAAGAAAAIAERRPRVVLFVGTAGSYGATPAIGSVAVARRICLAPTAVLRGEAYLPGPMTREVSADAPLRRALRGSGKTHVADVATTIGITRGRALAARIATATGCTVENLEAFAVACAAGRAGTPFAAVLGVSNRVGPTAHREWLTHAAQATRAACSVIERWLPSATAPSRAPPRSRRRA